MYSVLDPEFRPYGRVIPGLSESDRRELVRVLEALPITRGVVYMASEPALENLSAFRWLEREVYGEMPVQAGWCNGYNRAMNALEYHKASEVNLMVSDSILLLGQVQDVDTEYHYDTARAQAFLVPRGTLIEIYGTTLHYAPIHTGPEGFRSLVVLPRGTNTPLEHPHTATGESRLLLAKNKWLIGHPDAELDAGCWRGLQGKNVDLGPIEGV